MKIYAEVLSVSSFWEIFKNGIKGPLKGWNSDLKKKKTNPEVFTGHRIEGLQSKSEVKLERGQAYKD